MYIPAIRSQKMTCLTFAYSLPSHTSGVIQIFQTGTNTGNATLMKQMSGYHGPHWKSTFVQFLPSFEPMQVLKTQAYIHIWIIIIITLLLITIFIIFITNIIIVKLLLFTMMKIQKKRFFIILFLNHYKFTEQQVLIF